MKFDSYVGVITNSSSMLYVLHSERVANIAQGLLDEYGTKLRHTSNQDDLELLLDEAGHVLHELFYKLPEHKHNSVPFEPRETYYERYEAWSSKFNTEMREKIKDVDPFYFFLPDREDNEMSKEEMDMYESLSSERTMLS